MIVLDPTLGFLVGDTAVTLPALLAGGGRLVLLGENEATSSTANAHLRDLLATVPDVELTLSTDSVNIGCFGTVERPAATPPAGKGPPATASPPASCSACSSSRRGGDAREDEPATAGRRTHEGGGRPGPACG